MSANIVLPTLSLWAASHLASILESKTRDAFNAVFDATFANACNITVNGKQLTRDQYKSLLLEQSGAAPLESSTSVDIEGQTEVEGSDGQLSGFVGLFYTSLSDSRYLVLGAPAESRATSSLNLVIEPTEKDPRDPKVPIRGYFDPRRVVTVNQIVAENTYHVTIPAASVPKVTTTADSPATKIELGPGPLNLPAASLGGRFGPGRGPFGGRFGHGPVWFPPPVVIGANPDLLPGDGEFGVGPVVIPGERFGHGHA